VVRGSELDLGGGDGGGLYNDFGGTVTISGNASITGNVPDECVNC
jgi:hypothetical protein